MKDKKRTYSIFADIVRYDNELSSSCRLLFSEIAALSKQKGYCYANNQYFAQTFEVSISSVSKWIHQLEEKGYVDVEYIRKGSHVKCRKIYLNLELCDGYRYLKKKVDHSNSDEMESSQNEETHPADTKYKNSLSKNKGEERFGVYGNLKNVYLSEDEYESIIKKCGFRDGMILINDLSYHLGSTGRKYKSHYNTIISWYRRKASEKIRRPSRWYMEDGEEMDE